MHSRDPPAPSPNLRLEGFEPELKLRTALHIFVGSEYDALIAKNLLGPYKIVG